MNRDDFTPDEQRRLSNAVRQVVVSAEGYSRTYANAIQDDDSVDDFKRLHGKLQAPVLPTREDLRPVRDRFGLLHPGHELAGD